MSASRKKKERKLLEAEKASLNAASKGKEKKTGVDRALRDVLIVVAIIVLAVIITIVSVSCRNYNKKNAVVATVGNHEIKTPMMNYAYMDAVNSFYNQYSSYISLFLDPNKALDEQECAMDSEADNWAEFFVNMAADSLGDYYNICDYAKEIGYELSEDEQAQIDKSISSLKDYAKNIGKSADSYLQTIYGLGCNLDNYKDYVTLQVTASGCYQAYCDSIKVSDEDASAKYAEDPSAFDTVSYYMVSKNASEFLEGEATEVGDAEKAAAKAAAEEVKKDFDTAELSSASNTKANLTASYTEEAAEWLYDDARKSGDVEIFAKEDETGYYVFSFLAKDKHNYNTVNYQSIVIAADTTAEDSDAALEQAFATYTEIKDKINADNFADIAQEYGLAVVPGENVTKDSIDESVQSWLFSKSRKENDLESFNVGTAYYFYLYESAGENCNNMLVKNRITSELQQQWQEDHAHVNAVDVKKDKIDCLKTDLIIANYFNAA